jgi:23S rRNA (adenine2503-C2)-methyltransferase
MLIARKKEMPTNIVFMGMGEPMYNYDNVMKAASILNHPDGLHLSARHITISTAGVIPGIERMIKEKRTFNLAVSLNHPNPAKRGEIMDVEKRFPLPSLLKTLRTFSNHASRSVTFEYVMIPGINISKKDAEDLIKIARPLKAKINLIPYNSESKKWRAPTDDEIVDFQEILLNADLFVFNRGSAGKDINGACGMLACKRSGKA